jgi:hypothetical protein
MRQATLEQLDGKPPDQIQRNPWKPIQLQELVQINIKQLKENALSIEL